MPDASHAKGSRRPPCPTCGKVAEEQYRPFCSKRCADVDLGRWLGERYAIPGEPADLPAGSEPDETG